MNVEWIIETVTAAIAVATIITAATPTTSDNAWLNAVLKVINTVAGNIGKNTNKDA